MAAFDWGGYLTLATSLAEQPDEASRRSAVSRAYYYVYHLALSRAESNEFKAVEGGSHKQMWNFYLGSPLIQCQELANLGTRMKSRREKADYRAVYPRLVEEVGDVLDEARRFAELLNRVDARHPNQASQRR